MSNKGFTLIEVLVGLIILAVGLLALAALQISSIRGNSFSNNLMQATYVAQDRLEFLENLPLTYPPYPQLQAGNHNETIPPISGVVFNGSYTVTVNGNLTTIAYTVSWNDGVNHNITFSTIRSQ